jgi:hypothetical protein
MNSQNDFNQINLVWFMVFNATFNKISSISWQSVSLVEETGVPGENHWPAASHWQIFSHNVVSSTPRLSRVQTHNVSGDNQTEMDMFDTIHEIYKIWYATKL